VQRTSMASICLRGDDSMARLVGTTRGRAHWVLWIGFLVVLACLVAVAGWLVPLLAPFIAG